VWVWLGDVNINQGQIVDVSVGNRVSRIQGVTLEVQSDSLLGAHVPCLAVGFDDG
jgi:hypothetical protein